MGQLGHLHQLAGRPARIASPPATRAWRCSARATASSGCRATCTWCTASRCSRCPAARPTARRSSARALLGKQKLGDIVGMAYALDMLGWLSAKIGRPHGPRGCSAPPLRSGSAAAARGSAAPRSWRSSTCDAERARGGGDGRGAVRRGARDGGRVHEGAAERRGARRVPSVSRSRCRGSGCGALGGVGGAPRAACRCAQSTRLERVSIGATRDRDSGQALAEAGVSVVRRSGAPGRRWRASRRCGRALPDRRG